MKLKKSKIKSIYLGSIDVFESNKIAYRFGNQFSFNNFHLMSGIYTYKDNFSIIEIKEKNLPHTLINKNLLRSIA